MPIGLIVEDVNFNHLNLVFWRLFVGFHLSKSLYWKLLGLRERSYFRGVLILYEEINRSVKLFGGHELEVMIVKRLRLRCRSYWYYRQCICCKIRSRQLQLWKRLRLSVQLWLRLDLRLRLSVKTRLVLEGLNLNWSVGRLNTLIAPFADIRSVLSILNVVNVFTDLPISFRRLDHSLASLLNRTCAA